MSVNQAGRRVRNPADLERARVGEELDGTWSGPVWIQGHRHAEVLTGAVCACGGNAAVTHVPFEGSEGSDTFEYQQFVRLPSEP